MRTVQRIEESVNGAKVDPWANDHRRGHNGSSGLKLPQLFARQSIPGIKIAIGITHIKSLGGHRWCGDNPAGPLPGGETPLAPRLAGRPRHRELPEPELGPDECELVLPRKLTGIGCHSEYPPPRGEIDQAVGDDGGVLQTVRGAITQPALSGPGMQSVKAARP